MSEREREIEGEREIGKSSSVSTNCLAGISSQ